MALEDFRSFHRNLLQTGTLVSYSGPLFQGLNEEVCETLEFYFKGKRPWEGLQPKLFSIFVEVSQNLRTYVQGKAGDKSLYLRISGSGAVSITKVPEGFQVSSVNLVADRDVPALAGQLDSVKRLSPEAIKKVFRDVLRDKIRQERSTGLGFLDISKKTGGNFSFEFEPAGDGCTYFFFQATLPAPQEAVLE